MNSRGYALVAGLWGAGCLAPRAGAQTAAQTAALATLIPVRAGATVDRDTVSVGDVVRLSVRVHAPLGATIEFPSAVDSLSAVQALEPPRIVNGADSASAADRVALYRVAAWDVGAQPIRLGDVIVQTEDGERRVTLALPSLAVRSILPADSSLRVPKGPRPPLTPSAPMAWWWWAAAIAAVLAVGGAVWWWRRHGGASIAPPADPLRDAERHFARIEQLGLVPAGEAGRHAILMTDVLRRYLAARLESASLAHTSSELLHALRGAPSVPVARLAALLATVDAAKFAHAPVTPAEARAAGAEARAIVSDEHAAAERLAAAAVGADAAERARRVAA